MIADASIIYKLLLRENNSLEARNVFNQFDQCMAPELLQDEILNSFTRAIRKKLATTTEIWEAYEVWQAMLKHNAIRLLSHTAYQRTALIFSENLNHGYYDCLYLAMAQQQQMTLLTADERFYAKALSVYPNVKLLPNDA